MIAYFDTSALVKAVIEENGSDQATRLWEQTSKVVVSRLVYPETFAALAAARRAHRLTDEDYALAVRVFLSRYQRCIRVSVSDRLVDRAAELAVEHSLHGADAIHLATALTVLEHDPVFVTWDKRLHQATSRAGLVTAPAEI